VIIIQEHVYFRLESLSVTQITAITNAMTHNH